MGLRLAKASTQPLERGSDLLCSTGPVDRLAASGHLARSGSRVAALPQGAFCSTGSSPRSPPSALRRLDRIAVFVLGREQIILELHLASSAAAFFDMPFLTLNADQLRLSSADSACTIIAAAVCYNHQAPPRKLMSGENDSFSWQAALEVRRVSFPSRLQRARSSLMILSMPSRSPPDSMSSQRRSGISAT
jgi:hypothetical protein